MTCAQGKKRETREEAIANTQVRVWGPARKKLRSCHFVLQQVRAEQTEKATTLLGPTRQYSLRANDCCQTPGRRAGRHTESQLAGAETTRRKLCGKPC